MKRMKKFVIGMLVLAFLVPFINQSQEAAAANNFTDIRGHWAEATIAKWAELGLVSGQSTNRFNPNAPITRAELATLINKVTRVQDEATIDYSDVPKNKWYYREVAKSVQAGYMLGYADGTFKPDAPITRQELAVLITRVTGVAEQQPPAAYADVVRAPEWSRGSIGAMIASGTITGKEPNRFNPRALSTRAEVVIILDRIGADRGF
ncbi:S-layer homology domain-containing protein [Paenibacillus daejeonensis]|uniref:S-layer homology domain-containing protein n=1 Tax=Paenibacillus daejeonensis TaxID=135193 RepID=UPI00036AEBD1|nr:S-layer homology domain-containing protein [Paenibacillus daejeonensis]